MSRLRAAALPAVFTGLLAAAALSGRQEGEPQVAIHPVAGGVHWIEGPGGNVVVLVGDGRLLLVDDKFAHLAPEVDQALASLDAGPVAYLVNTHWHGDHTGANEHFGAHATILAHENVRRRLAGDATIGGRTLDQIEPAGLPVVTFEDGITIHFDGETVVVRYLPSAHTDGDSWLLFEHANVVHTGDLFFEAFYPFIDLDSGGSVRGYVDAVRALVAAVPEDARIVPGHGKPTDVAGLRAFLEMLETTTTRVSEALAAGESVDEMMENGLLADYDGRWGGSDFMTPRRYLEILARGLGGQ